MRHIQLRLKVKSKESINQSNLPFAIWLHWLAKGCISGTNLVGQVISIAQTYLTFQHIAHNCKVQEILIW
jgi:hypothetical protein